MSKSAKCWSCKATYHFDEKDWDSFICEICKTFISKERANVYLRTINYVNNSHLLSTKKGKRK